MKFKHQYKNKVAIYRPRLLVRHRGSKMKK